MASAGDHLGEHFPSNLVSIDLDILSTIWLDSSKIAIRLGRKRIVCPAKMQIDMLRVHRLGRIRIHLSWLVEPWKVPIFHP